MSADQSVHPHPNRHRKALKRALGLAGSGILVWAIGLFAIFAGLRAGLIISLVVVGITMLLLSPVWYFSYMENLEPELYRHDK